MAASDIRRVVRLAHPDRLSVSLRRIEWLHPTFRRTLQGHLCLFQYPFVGSNGCIVGPAGQRGGADRRLSVSLRRIEWLHLAHILPRRLRRAEAPFSIPSSDRMAASVAELIAAGLAAPPSFSIPSSDRMAASCTIRSVVRRPAPSLSVSLRRIEWLHRRSPRSAAPAGHRLSVSLRRIEWLHPRSISAKAGCRWPFSIPSSDRMAASCGHVGRRHGGERILSVSLRRIEWLHLEIELDAQTSLPSAFSIPSSDRMAASVPAAWYDSGLELPFQYPFVGSNGCITRWITSSRSGWAALSVSLRRIEWLHPRPVRRAGHSVDGTFSIPSSDRMAASTSPRGPIWWSLVHFQYPFVGSNGCIPTSQAGAAPASRPFSIPSSDRMAASRPGLCDAWNVHITFSIPSSDRMAASSSLPTGLSHILSAFSIPSSDRMAASDHVEAVAPAHAGELSVSLRRIEWLHLLAAIPHASDGLTFSIPSSDRMAASAQPRTLERSGMAPLSVSLRRIEWLHPAVLEIEEGQAKRPFSIPSSDRMAASGDRGRARGDRGRARFQYPFVGSNGCISALAQDSVTVHPVFQYPFVGSNGCIQLGQFLPHGIATRRLSVSLRRIEWLHHPARGGGPRCPDRRLSVSLRRIEWLHRWRPCSPFPRYSRLFQYPFVGSNGCIEPVLRVLERQWHSFQYPFVGSNGCIDARRFVSCRPEETFSIPSSDRMAASASRSRLWRQAESLSVSLRRIEWLHPSCTARSRSPAPGHFQYPFVGSNGCIRSRMRSAGRCCLPAFSIPSSDRMAASRRRVRLQPEVGRDFQYPFVGSNGCIRCRCARPCPGRGTLSVSLRRIEWLHRASTAASRSCCCWAFSIPSSDRMAASQGELAEGEVLAGHLLSVSLRRIEWLHPGRAEPDHDLADRELSVSLRRIEWLHRHRPAGCAGTVAPLSVSLRRIEWLHRGGAREEQAGEFGQLSVSLRRIEWLHPRRGRDRALELCQLSVSLRRIEWLHLVALKHRLHRRPGFQYPFVGSNGCIILESLQFGRRLSLLFQYPFVGSNGCIHPAALAGRLGAGNPFSIPSSDRMAASNARAGSAGEPHHRFQYPFVGSNGCIRTSGDSATFTDAHFQYPFVGSNGCILVLVFPQPDGSVAAFSIPSSDRMAASNRRCAGGFCARLLSVSLRRIEWLHLSQVRW